ncbi:MAG: PstS family phosphate ABC transporter substrate-binding protein [Phycisphaerae bacterium]
MRNTRTSLVWIGALAVALATTLNSGCGPAPTGGTGSQPAKPTARKAAEVVIDGSSTLGPMLEVAAELFKAENREVKLNVRTSGTSSGFGKLLTDVSAQQIDICKASRPIARQEAEKATKDGIEFVELPVALDGIALVISPKNDFAKSLTLAELKKIWEPGSTVNNWKDVRAGFPDVPLKLYGPGLQSGTFDVFTEKVVGKAKEQRRDMVSSEQDQTLVHGVSNEAGALGYFGFAYYEENKTVLRELGIDRGDGKAVVPTPDTIRSGEYPLARPLFLYVRKQSLERAEVRAFIEFFVKNVRKIVEHEKVSSVALTDELYQATRARFEKPVTGTVYSEPGMDSKPLSELYLKKP